MQKKIRILIIEDEVAIREGLVDVFLYHGYEVDFSGDGNEGLDKALRGNFDLVLLDVMLPGLDGFEICNRIRQQDDTQGREQAIIMLTAKNMDEDIIKGLSLGADDYVAKPFSITQLVLRVQAVLRRTQPPQLDQHLIQLADGTQIDRQNMSGLRGQQELSFTRREIQVLQYLYANTQRPVSREELLNKVWGYASDIELETRTVDIHIAKLRRKIEHNPSKPQYLITVRGAGYRLLGSDAS